MRDKEDLLIERLKSYVTIGAPSVSSECIAYPPVTDEELEDAERKIGFRLPSLLRKIYLHVGDGGFGSWYGLLSLDTDRERDRWSMTRWYLAMRSMTQEDIDTHWADEAQEDTPGLWPEKLLAICDWGCNISSSIDCSQPECPVYRQDNNINAHKFILKSPSLWQWLTDWLDGISTSRDGSTGE